MVPIPPPASQLSAFSEKSTSPRSIKHTLFVTSVHTASPIPHVIISPLACPPTPDVNDLVSYITLLTLNAVASSSKVTTYAVIHGQLS